MTRRSVFCLVAALGCAALHADLEKGFKAPPAAAKPHTWFHMMNGNTFTCGVLHLKDAGQLDAAAGEVKTYVMNTQWMCGFPDKLVVASLDGYLISVFGAEDLVDTFRDKLQTAYPGTQIVSDDPIA